MQQSPDKNTVRRRRGIWTVRDVWYEHAAAYADADIIYYLQSEKPFGDEHYEQFTLLSDLSDTEENLWAKIGKSCREKIRSVNGNPEVQSEIFFSPDEKQFEQFIADYNKLSEFKGIARAEEQRMRSYLEENLLVLSRATGPGGATLVWHAYRHHPGRTLLLYTVSLWFESADSRSRNLTGKVNRFLHWKDMLAFREKGTALYDWGGWHNGQENEELLRINRFKEEFGGTVKENYNCIVYRGWKGKLFRLLKKMKG